MLLSRHLQRSLGQSGAPHMIRILYNFIYSCPPTGIFRPPPADSSTSYSPYVSPTTADLISTFTIPSIKAILIELLTLGKTSMLCYITWFHVISHIGRALGFPDTPDGLPSSIVMTSLDEIRLLHSKASSSHFPSMLVDAERGRAIEVEVILGEVVRMAKQFKVDIPVEKNPALFVFYSLG